MCIRDSPCREKSGGLKHYTSRFIKGTFEAGSEMELDLRKVDAESDSITLEMPAPPKDSDSAALMVKFVEVRGRVKFFTLAV